MEGSEKKKTSFVKPELSTSLPQIGSLMMDMFEIRFYSAIVAREKTRVYALSEAMRRLGTKSEQRCKNRTEGPTNSLA